MIGSLRGVVLERRSGEILLEVAGVGYRVLLPAAALGSVSVGTGELFVYTHQHFREDHQALYGFLTAAERDCFESLISAHGVGPALALAVLSVHRPDELVQILAEGDVSALCLVPGVGKKTAARLLVELRSKFDLDTFLANGSVAAAPAAGPLSVADSPQAIVRQALAELGYGAQEVRDAFDALQRDGIGGVENESVGEAELLRAALQRLAGGR